MLTTATLTMLVGLAGMAVAAPGAAAPSASARVQVKGSLIPGACAVHLAGNGMVDYGHIPRHSLPEHAPLQLVSHTIQLTVNCADPMTIRVTAKDERSGTAAVGLVPGEDEFAFGLGRVDETNIGQFRIQSVAGTFFAQDGQGRTGPVDILSTLVDRPAWARREHTYFWSNGASQQSFAAPGRLDPGAYRTVTGALLVETYINRRAQLPGGGIAMAGLATIEILY